MRITRTLATVLLLGLTLQAAQSRQTKPQQPVFRVGVDLVQVDVVVVDPTGNAVRGLQASDFLVTDRGQSQTVAAFEEVFHEKPAADDIRLPPTVKHDVADNRSAQSQRLVILVVDDLHIFQGRTDRAKDLAKELITTLGDGASMAVLFTSGEHSTSITEDRSVLLAAANTLKGRQPIRRPHEANDTQSAHGQDPEMSSEQLLDLLRTVGDAHEFEDNMQQYKTLEDAARMILNDTVRRKAFVLLSEGIAKDLTGLFTAGTSPCELADPKAPCHHDAALEKMMTSFRRANVTTYAIDPRGKVRPQDLMRESFPPPRGIVELPGAGTTEPMGSAAIGQVGVPTEDSQFRRNNPVRQAQDGLEFVAEASGGFAVTDTDDFEGGLRRIVMDLDHYYLLGFYPSDPSGDKFRALDVKIAGHPELTLRFRRGYMPGGPPPLPAKADPLISGLMPKTDLPVRLQAVPFPLANDRRQMRIAVALEVAAPTAMLMEADEKIYDDVTYQVVAIDEKKSAIASRTGRQAKLALHRIGTGPMPDTVAYQIQTSLDLAPGRYQLRASLNSTRLSAGGSAYLSVEVPDFKSASLALSGMVLGYADGPRVPVAPRTPTAAGVPVAPIVRLPFAPALDREFTRADRLRIYADVIRDGPARRAHWVLTAIDNADHAVELATAEIGFDNAEINVPVALAQFAPGAYRLRLSVIDGQTTAAQEVGIIVW